MLLNKILPEEAEKIIDNVNNKILQLCSSDFHTSEIVKIDVDKISGGAFVKIIFKTLPENLLKEKKRIETQLLSLKKTNYIANGEIGQTAFLTDIKQNRKFFKTKKLKSKKISLNKLSKLKFLDKSCYIHFEVIYYYSILKYYLS